MKLKKLQNKINYIFRSTDILNQALTHCSFKINNNERLEFLGDSILNYIISKEIYFRYFNLNEGYMSLIKSNLVSKKILFSISKKFELQKYIKTNSFNINKKENYYSSIMSNAMEALIGAIFLDSSIYIVQKLIINWYTPYLKNIKSKISKKDFKTKLQEYTQKYNSSLPNYKIRRIIGKSNNLIFVVYCKIFGLKHRTFGVGKTIKQAEQKSAKKMLELINF
ncbi:MAG: ribonuclease III [Enterobacteriaceae bacterium]